MTGFPKAGVPKFDWDNDESVVVPGQPAIAVYENARGNIVVREDYGPIVEIPPEHVARVVEAILKAAGLQNETFHGKSHDGPRDRTAAERQRRYRERKRNGGGVTEKHNTVTDEPELRPVTTE